MNNKTLAGLVIAGLLMSGAAFTALAQNGPGNGGKGNGKGYGGPPQTQEERAARQAACLEQNGGVCPNDGASTNCTAGGKGKGKGKGQGKGQGHQNGKRDGTGPRNASGNCPLQQ
jgi:hypothetical protein